MHRLISFFLFLAVSVGPQANLYASIKFQEVTTTGAGMSLDEAVNNALAEAITMINGKNIYTKTVIKVLGGESVNDSSDSQAKELQNFLSSKFSEIKQSLKNSSKEDGNSNDISININKPDKKQYSQKYVKDIINDVKGGIKSYEILTKKVDENGWHHVRITSQVAKFEISKEASRTRIAIVPFRFYSERTESSLSLDRVISSAFGDKNVKTLKSTDEKFKLTSSDKSRLLRLINQGLVNYLTQSRKFTILDRQYVEEIANEKLNIIEGRAPAIEMAKLGNELSGDYIFVGSVEDFTVKNKVIKIQSSGKEINRKHASFYVPYRLLDIATKQIKSANNYKITATLKSDEPIEIITELVDKGVKLIGQEILFSIYPVIVERYANNLLVLGQGGNQFKKGESYDLYEKGEVIVDSYTNETIGNIESYLGKVEITQVTANLSKAKFIEGKFDMSVGFIPGQYIVRPVVYDEAALKKERFKRTKAKILKARAEREKLLMIKKNEAKLKKDKRLEERRKKREERDRETDELY